MSVTWAFCFPFNFLSFLIMPCFCSLVPLKVNQVQKMNTSVAYKFKADQQIAQFLIHFDIFLCKSYQNCCLDFFHVTNSDLDFDPSLQGKLLRFIFNTINYPY